MTLLSGFQDLKRKLQEVAPIVGDPSMFELVDTNGWAAPLPSTMPPKALNPDNERDQGETAIALGGWIAGEPIVATRDFMNVKTGDVGYVLQPCASSDDPSVGKRMDVLFPNRRQELRLIKSWFPLWSKKLPDWDKPFAPDDLAEVVVLPKNNGTRHRHTGEWLFCKIISCTPGSTTLYEIHVYHNKFDICSGKDLHSVNVKHLRHRLHIQGSADANHEEIASAGGTANAMTPGEGHAAPSVEVDTKYGSVHRSNMVDRGLFRDHWDGGIELALVYKAKSSSRSSSSSNRRMNNNMVTPTINIGRKVQEESHL